MSLPYFALVCDNPDHALNRFEGNTLTPAQFCETEFWGHSEKLEAYLWEVGEKNNGGISSGMVEALISLALGMCGRMDDCAQYGDVIILVDKLRKMRDLLAATSLKEVTFTFLCETRSNTLHLCRTNLGPFVQLCLQHRRVLTATPAGNQMLFLRAQVIPLVQRAPTSLLLSDGELVRKIITLNTQLPGCDVTALLQSRPELLLMEEFEEELPRAVTALRSFMKEDIIELMLLESPATLLRAAHQADKVEKASGNCITTWCNRLNTYIKMRVSYEENPTEIEALCNDVKNPALRYWFRSTFV
eukprot:5224163-Pyramimonas_sp.AAC.1